ncbi:macro domain-containing protein [Vibrio breoganii]|uniref:macro domain-containing protein n=1 Tax=Vibrio breoganii TaxID=553239 RepID=UPI0010567E85|nr:macro domain-containing protein [Vibrio breoganii]
MRLAFIFRLEGGHGKSGSAEGSDLAIELGFYLAEYELARLGLISRITPMFFQSIIPWSNFNDRDTFKTPWVTSDIPQWAIDSAAQLHPAWDKLSAGVKRLMARNTLQIIDSQTKSPVDRVICYTGDGASSVSEITSKTGGTGQALRLACQHGVPIVNVGNSEHRSEMESYIFQRAMYWKETLGIDVLSITEFAYWNSPTGGESVNGDAIAFCEEGGGNVLVHNANIHNSFGRGFALSLYRRYPQSFIADSATVKGDKSKLGTYSVANVVSPKGHQFSIINVYGQAFMNADQDVCCVDYTALQKGLDAIAVQYKTESIVYPMIGAGLAGGSWLTISRMIRKSFSGMSHTLCRQ